MLCDAAPWLTQALPGAKAAGFMGYSFCGVCVGARRAMHARSRSLTVIPEDMQD